MTQDPKKDPNLKTQDPKEEKPLPVFFKSVIIGVVILVAGIIAFVTAIVLPVALSLKDWE